MAELIRSFIAVLLPEEVRRAVAMTIEELKVYRADVGWVRPENLHLTLRFLGEQGERELERAREALGEAAAQASPFAVGLKGLGAFPLRGRPRVVWVGVAEGADRLVGLQAAVEAALAVRGFHPEERPFHPHLTIGRVRGSRGVEALSAALGEEQVFGEAEVTALHLMRSDLHPTGARYSVLGGFPLGAER